MLSPSAVVSHIKTQLDLWVFPLLSDVNWWTGVVWITCGLSFWRHPFTVEHPLLRHWCNATFLQIWWKANSSTFRIAWGEVIFFLANIHFWVNYPLRSSGDTCRRGKSTHLLSHWDVRGCNQCQLIFQPVVVYEIIKSLNCFTYTDKHAQTHTHRLPQAHEVHAVVKVFGRVCVWEMGRDKKWQIAASVGCAVHASANP